MQVIGMVKTTDSRSTTEMWRRLFQTPSVDTFLEREKDGFTLPAFSDYITALCQSKGEKPERVIKRANLENSFGHRLFSGMRRPSRDTVLQLAFGLELNSDETQQLLKVAREAALHPKVKRDAIIAYGLHRRLSLQETQQLLVENSLPVMGGTKNGS